MSTWISLVVLSLAVVSTLGFPRPDEYHIPDVGQGPRAQYHVLHSDGTYKYGYDTGDGVYERSMAQAPGEVSGAFGYKDPTGADIKLEYTADEHGFVPHGDHLPAQPDNLFGLKISEDPSVDIRANTPSITPLSVKSPSTSNEVLSPANVPVIWSTALDDGSYSFAYKTSSSFRSESADAHNSVTGQYSFDGDDGISHEINYTAGSETGYIAEGDSLPRGPAVPGAESGVPTGKIIPVLSEEEANALASATTNASPQTSPPPSVFESAFVASDDAASFEETDSCEEHHAPDDNVSIDEPHTSPAVDNAVPAETAHIISSVPGDGSYGFSYETSSSSRSESADARNSVKGHYSFISGDGMNYKINYTAGPETGFIAEGDSLPIGPSVPGAENGIPTGQIHPDPSEDNTNIIPSHNSHITSLPSSVLPEVTDQIFPQAHYSDVSDSNLTETESPSDSSYFFKYDAGDSARVESADADLNIKGSYMFVVPEGLKYSVHYIAGSDTGFVASIKEETPTSDANSNSEPTPYTEVPTTIDDTIPPEKMDVQKVTPNPFIKPNKNGGAAATAFPANTNVYGKVVGSRTYVDQRGNEYRITYIDITAPNTSINPEEINNPIPQKVIHTDTSTDVNGKVGQLTYIDNNGTEYKITYVAPSFNSVNPNEYPISIPNGVFDINAVNANADGNVVGHQTYIDQNGNEYRITYIVTKDPDLALEEDSPPSVPDPKVPIDNAHLSSFPADGSHNFSDDTVKSSGFDSADATPPDTNVYGKVVGSQTYVDQRGNEYRITYITAPNTSINPLEFNNPIPQKVIHTDTSTDVNGKVGQLTYIDNNGTEYKITYVAPSFNSVNPNEYSISIPNGVFDINVVNANADGNVVGHQTYIDQIGNEYRITYIVTKDPDLAPEEDSPPSVPDPKVPIDKATPADTNVYGKVVGSQTYVDQRGNEYRITYITAPNTGINPEEYNNPIPQEVFHTDTSTDVSGKVGQLTYIDNNSNEYKITYVAPSIYSSNSNTYPVSIPNGIFDINAVNANADGNLVGHQTYIDQNGYEYRITYIVTPDPVLAPGEDSPPSVPDPKVPTDEAHSSSFPAKSSGFDSADATPADTNVYGKVVGSQTYVDQRGNEYRITYITAPNTGINPEEYNNPIPQEVFHSDMSTDVSGKVGQRTYIDNNGNEYKITYVAPSIKNFNPNEYPISIPNGVFDTNAVNANEDGTVVGHQTYIDQNGNEHKITYIVTKDPDLAPEEDSPPSVPDPKVPTDDAHSSSFPSDGSYNFSYDTSESSRFESADATNSVTGHYSFIADDGIKRKIDYKTGAETGYVAQGDSLPVGPPVPGAENGIPTGHILPILSEEEANALGSVSSPGETDSLQESNENTDITEAPGKTDVNENVVGYGTYLDQNGTEFRITYIAPTDTGINHNVNPTPNPIATVDTTESQIHGGSDVTVSHKQAEKTQNDQGTSLSPSHSIRKVGDVLLHQYDPTNRDKYGYVYTAID